MSTNAVCPIARRSARRRSRCATPCSPSRTEAATPAIASTSAALSTCPLPMRTGRVVTESPRGGKPAPGAFQRRTLCYSPAHGSGNDILRACDPTLCLGEQFQKIFQNADLLLTRSPGRFYTPRRWMRGCGDSRLGDGAVRERFRLPTGGRHGEEEGKEGQEEEQGEEKVEEVGEDRVMYRTHSWVC